LGGACCFRVKDEKSSRKHTRDLLKNPNRRVDDDINPYPANVENMVSS